MSKIKDEFKKITYGTKSTLVLPKSSFMEKGGYLAEMTNYPSTAEGKNSLQFKL